MFKLILQAVEQQGFKARVVAVDRIQDLRRNLVEFAASHELNSFQQYILREMYQFSMSDPGFPVRSVIVAAKPGPAWADVWFTHATGILQTKGLARYYPGGAPVQETVFMVLNELLGPLGYHIVPAGTLPLKRLAVCSGLARYGRNNITYVDGMGSFHGLAAFYSDIPVEAGDWHEATQMDRCVSCSACVGNCPTGALKPDRFLMDNMRCLSFFNEVSDPFPDWLPATVHHCLYDCLMCQVICPENKPYLGNVIGPIVFNREETEALLEGMPLEEFPTDTQEKIKLLGMDQWMDAIPRNIAVLLDNQLKQQG